MMVTLMRKKVERGSDPDQASSTPKTLAEDAYNKAKATYDAFEAKKQNLQKVVLLRKRLVS